MLEDYDLHRLSFEQRRALAARLAEIDGIWPEPQISDRRWRAGATFFSAASAFMLVWILVLAVTLPARYVAGGWRVAWVGFDVALLGALGTLAWAGWRRRHVLLPAMIVAGTLLACDAWFDITLSWGGREAWISLLTAVLGEIPLAVVLLRRARLLILQIGVDLARIVGAPDVPHSLHRMPLFVITPGGSAAPQAGGDLHESRPAPGERR